ncbi:hypothetical protein A0H81_00040 [Grifola frondosa]|uniref:Nucleoside phosphorylase domain-containing protein n=1 Tax=Grifola frondosa TaxID=5627 RepID=A0A1C7MQS1_GRIFR|nr:hypothetical protein A0H81_00040 [Grifola frondosa]
MPFSRFSSHVGSTCLSPRLASGRGGQPHCECEGIVLRNGTLSRKKITVGAPSRAQGIGSYLDPSPRPFTLNSERGFTTITGRYKGVPISIVSIGMGSSNADFFMREVRECLNGDMVVVRSIFSYLVASHLTTERCGVSVRLGSCGALIDVPVGSVVVPRASIAVTRNYDFNFATGLSDEPPYRISKANLPFFRFMLIPLFDLPWVYASLASIIRDLNSYQIRESLARNRPSHINKPIVDNILNASTDSFYSSQGRQTSFPDHNSDLIDNLISSHKDLATFEMETFHILHLAASWHIEAHDMSGRPPPITRMPTSPSIYPSHLPSTQENVPDVATSAAGGKPLIPQPRIIAAATQMVFASRTSQDFITPQEVAQIEAWCGRAVLDALIGIAIDTTRLHDEVGSVWELKAGEIEDAMVR